MLVGTSPVKSISATTTTGAINTPINVQNGDIEVVHVVLNNTTSGTFVGATGWAAIPSCSASGNTVQGIAFAHTASSESATVTPVTWTTNGTGLAWITAFRNTSGVDICAANTNAAATTATTAGFTAAATTDRVVAIVATTANAAWGLPIATLTNNTVHGLVIDGGQYTNGQTFNEVSYPITSTTVAGLGFSGQSSVTVTFNYGMTYAASTTSGVPGALTYNQTGSSYLNGLTLGQGLCSLGTNCFSLNIPPNNVNNGATVGGISSSDYFSGRQVSLLGFDGQNVIIGDVNVHNGSSSIIPQVNVASATGKTITTTTGAMGPTGGGVLQSYGGTLPTCACTGGSPTCTAQTGASNSAGELDVTGGTGMTTCTLTFSASDTFHAAPVCLFTDKNASVTPLSYSTGAESTSTVVFDFASATAFNVNYICVGH